MSWFAYGLISAAAAALTAILAKIGVEGVPTVLLAALWLREPVSWQVACGVVLMVAGALLTRA